MEDGTGLSTANAFVAVATFKSYATDRGHDYSSYSDALIEQAIVRATDYLRNERRFDYRGTKGT